MGGGLRTGESGPQSRTELSTKSFQYFIFVFLTDMGKAKETLEHLNFTAMKNIVAILQVRIQGLFLEI